MEGGSSAQKNSILRYVMQGSYAEDTTTTGNSSRDTRLVALVLARMAAATTSREQHTNESLEDLDSFTKVNTKMFCLAKCTVRISEGNLKLANSKFSS